jgi:hypothetical protein
MAVRTSMSAIITKLRTLVNDTSGSSTYMFTDQELQDALDQHQFTSIYEQLQPVENILAGGTVEYKTYLAEYPYWESDAVLVDGNYNALTPATSDFNSGQFTFTASRQPPVLIYGNWYDIFATAADVWGWKAAKYADKFSFAVDGGNYQLDQQYQHAIDQAKLYRQKSSTLNGNTFLERADVFGG